MSGNSSSDETFQAIRSYVFNVKLGDIDISKLDISKLSLAQLRILVDDFLNQLPKKELSNENVAKLCDVLELYDDSKTKGLRSTLKKNEGKKLNIGALKASLNAIRNRISKEKAQSSLDELKGEKAASQPEREDFGTKAIIEDSAAKEPDEELKEIFLKYVKSGDRRAFRADMRSIIDQSEEVYAGKLNSFDADKFIVSILSDYHEKYNNIALMNFSRYVNTIAIQFGKNVSRETLSSIQDFCANGGVIEKAAEIFEPEIAFDLGVPDENQRDEGYSDSEAEVEETDIVSEEVKLQLKNVLIEFEQRKVFLKDSHDKGFVLDVNDKDEIEILRYVLKKFKPHPFNGHHVYNVVDSEEDFLFNVARDDDGDFEYCIDQGGEYLPFSEVKSELIDRFEELQGYDLSYDSGAELESESESELEIEDELKKNVVSQETPSASVAGRFVKALNEQSKGRFAHP